MTDEVEMELEHDLDHETEALEAAAVAPEDRPPLELTETALEGLLFVAERPLTRREIATLAGVDRETVDARLGDLEVSLRERGIRLIVELGRSETPGRPFLYGTSFEFLERFGLTSLEEMPPLDVDVAARLAEEGGEPLTESLGLTDLENEPSSDPVPEAAIPDDVTADT
jgi:segregation and condensation protein B